MDFNQDFANQLKTTQLRMTANRCNFEGKSKLVRFVPSPPPPTMMEIWRQIMVYQVCRDAGFAPDQYIEQ